MPFGEEEGLLDASVFMDKNECDTVIKIARSSAGVSSGELLDGVNQAVEDFSEAAKGRFGNSGEFGD